MRVYAHILPSLEERLAAGLDRAHRESLAAPVRPKRGPEVVELTSTGREQRA